MDHAIVAAAQQAPWNKGRLVGQKLPLRLREIWAIRFRLQMAKRVPDAVIQEDQALLMYYDNALMRTGE